MGKSSNSTAATTQTSQADNRVVLGNDAVQVGAFGSYDRSTHSSFDISDSRDMSSHWTDNSSRDYSDRSTSNTSFQVNDSSSRDNSQHYVDARDLSDRSVNSYSDSRDFSQWTDASNRSTNNTSFQASDSRDLSQHFVDSRDLSQRFADSRDQSDRSTNDNRVSITGADSAQIVALNNGLLQAVGERNTDTVRLLASMGTDSIKTQAQAATNLFQTGSAEATAAWGHTIDKSTELIDKMLTNASATITGAQTVARDAISSYQPADAKQSDVMLYALLAVAGVAAILIIKKG